MRTIEPTGQFKRDYKHVRKGRYAVTIVGELNEVVTALANDEPLAPNLFDHWLQGKWRGHRDCHVKPDLVLVYRKPDDDRLQLVRLASHAELGW